LLDRIPVCGIFSVIRSFSDKRAEALFWDRVVPTYGQIARRAKRKLESINAAHRLEDLRVPPSNRLEKLKGSLEAYYSIRINDQWRVVFRWVNGDAYDVAIIDYH
jgi:proteic killer suppression protein